jgi:hypothetical protein
MWWVCLRGCTGWRLVGLDDWDRLAGMVCVCRLGCTVGDVWGDGPVECDAGCEPCRLMRGRPYVPRQQKRNVLKRGRWMGE